jgi:hypothetical protein
MFMLWNETDGISASHDLFKTEAEAEAFAKRFRKRFEVQGYYLTFDLRRISPVEGVLIAAPASF